MEKEDARMLLELAMELRLRVLNQLHIMNNKEFCTTELSYIDRDTSEKRTIEIIGEGDRTSEAF
jgi:predicted ATP-dependent Lon-type protease